MTELTAHAESAISRQMTATPRESQDSRFRTLVETSPQGIIVHRDWKILYANAAAAGTLGYASVSELMSLESMLSLFPEDERSRLKSYRDARLAHRPAPNRYQTRFLHKCRGIMWAELLANVLDWQGEPAVVAVIVDISERVRAQQMLRDSEERYALTMEGANVGMWDWHIETNSLYGSANVWRYLGIPVQEEAASPDVWLERVHPDDRAHTHQCLIAHLRGETEYCQCEHRVLKADGSYGWFYAHGLALRRENGRAYRLAGSLHDITARKNDEQALSDRLRFEALLTRISAEFIALPPAEIDAVIARTVDTIGRFLDVDRAWFLQIDRARCGLEYVHEWCGDGIHPERQEEGMSYFPADRFPWYWEQLLGGKSVVISSPDDFPAEAAAERRFELERGVQSFVSISLGTGGTVVGRLGFETIKRPKRWNETVINQLKIFGQVITSAVARKNTDTALRESEERFRNLIEGSLQGICIVDTGFAPLFVNSAYAEMFGYANTEQMQRSESQLDLFSGEDRARIAGYGEARLRGDPVPLTYEIDGTRKDGTLIHMVSTLRLITWKGRPAYQITATDITEHKRTEARLHEYQQQLRRLASEISLAEEQERRRIASELHDGAIQNLALAKIKLGEFEKSLKPERRGATLDEIRDLLELSIHDTRSLVFELSPPVLYELGLEAAIEWLGEQFQTRYGISCGVTADRSETPRNVNMEVILFQVLRELLVNVVKHANSTRVDITLRRSGDCLSLRVRDDGDGFDDAAVATGSGGGFGLFNIRERLQLLGATLKIVSDQGTCVTVTAPLAAEAPESPP